MSTSSDTSAGIPAVKWEPVSPASPSRNIAPHASIVARLIGYTEEYWPRVRSDGARARTEEEASMLADILELVRRETAIETRELNPTMVMRRIRWRMRINGVDSLASYKKVLEERPIELPALRKSLLIRVTDFFRDPNVYFRLESAIIPNIVKQAGHGGIRILVHGCGAGEEAYSMALLLDAYAKKARKSIPVRILANDADKNALIRARRGFYPHLITADLSAFCLDQFFEATREGYCVRERIRNMVRFMPGHADDPAAFSNLNLLICRNALLLSDPDTTDQLLATFFNRLQPDGYLVIDPSVESVHMSKYFDIVDAEHGIHRRKKTVGRPLEDGETNGEAEDVNLQAVVRRLEEELYHTQERLRMAITEYETTHDDLVDTNHELQSTLRDLNLEKNQLQAEHTALEAMKEGVLAANKEFKKQNDKIRHSLLRLEGILAQSGVGVMCLNREQGIELFTPGAGSIMGLTRADIGRPISSFNASFQQTMSRDAASVLRTHSPIEREEATSDGRWYRIATNPFILEGRLEGVVCTFVDITEQRQSAEWNRYKAGILENMAESVLITNKDLNVTYMNKAAVARYGLHNKKHAGMKLSELYRNAWKTTAEKEHAHRELAEQGLWTGLHAQITPDGRQFEVDASIHLLSDATGEETGILTVVRDARHVEQDDPESLRALIDDLERRSDALVEASNDIDTGSH